jgi:hypothetical protein
LKPLCPQTKHALSQVLQICTKLSLSVHYIESPVATTETHCKKPYSKKPYSKKPLRNTQILTTHLSNKKKKTSKNFHMTLKYTGIKLHGIPMSEKKLDLNLLWS